LVGGADDNPRRRIAADGQGKRELGHFPVG